MLSVLVEGLSQLAILSAIRIVQAICARKKKGRPTFRRSGLGLSMER
jgi:hypothetical protein